MGSKGGIFGYGRILKACKPSTTAVPSASDFAAPRPLGARSPRYHPHPSVAGEPQHPRRVAHVREKNGEVMIGPVIGIFTSSRRPGSRRPFAAFTNAFAA